MELLQFWAVLNRFDMEMSLVKAWKAFERAAYEPRIECIQGIAFTSSTDPPSTGS